MKCFLRSILLFVLVGEFSLLIQGKIFTRCGLTQELIKLNFQRTYIGNWVCLVESESGKDTSKVTIKADGSKSLGLFQINSKEWCTFGKAGGKCALKCEDLTDENLIDDSACAKRCITKKDFEVGMDGREIATVVSCLRQNVKFFNNSILHNVSVWKLTHLIVSNFLLILFPICTSIP